MRQTRVILWQCAVSALLLLFLGCSSDSHDIELSAQPETLVLSEDNDYQAVVTIRSNTSWVMQTDSWLALSLNSGTGTQNITVSVPRLSNVPQDGSVLLTVVDRTGKESCTVKVQVEKEPTLIDYTDKVGVTPEDWHANDVTAEEWAPLVSTADWRKVQVVEVYYEPWHYDDDGSGDWWPKQEMMWQKITSLPQGNYIVELYANTQFTDERGFDSPLVDGADNVAYVEANGQRAYLTAHIGQRVAEHGVYTISTQVSNGELRLSFVVEKAGTNWHTIQIKKLTKVE